MIHSKRSQLKVKGDVEIIGNYEDGSSEVLDVANTVLYTGRTALAKCLANNIGDSFGFYITRMLFGDGGTQSGVKKYVNANRNGLFGTTRISKPVIATIDPTLPTQVIFTSVIKKSEVIGVALNEMALQMATGDLYSMVTFADLNKTADLQLTLNWRINFI